MPVRLLPTAKTPAPAPPPGPSPSVGRNVTPGRQTFTPTRSPVKPPAAPTPPPDVDTPPPVPIGEARAQKQLQQLAAQRQSAAQAQVQKNTFPIIHQAPITGNDLGGLQETNVPIPKMPPEGVLGAATSAERNHPTESTKPIYPGQQPTRWVARGITVDPGSSGAHPVYELPHGPQGNQEYWTAQQEALARQAGGQLTTAGNIFTGALGAFIPTRVASALANGKPVTWSDVGNDIVTGLSTGVGIEAAKGISSTALNILRTSGTASTDITEGAVERAIANSHVVQDNPMRHEIWQTLQGADPESAAATMKAYDLAAQLKAEQLGITPEDAYAKLWAGASHHPDLSPTAADLQQGVKPQINEVHQTPEERVLANQGLKFNPRNAEKGMPVNDVLTSGGHRIFGEPTNEEWLSRLNAYTPDVKQQARDAAWYSRLEDAFNKAFGEHYGPAALRGFLVSQANAGPADGLSSVLRVMDRLERGAPVVDQHLGGVGSTMANEIAQAVKGEILQRGQAGKLSDFIDSARGKLTRTWMGDHPGAGEPAAGDIWSGRDRGLVDTKLASESMRGRGATVRKFVLAEHGVDLRKMEPEYRGVLSGNRYERTVEFYNRLKDHLNQIAYHGRTDWKASEVQAMGWMNMQRFYGREPQEIEQWISSAIDKYKRAKNREIGLQAERHATTQRGVHLVPGARRDIMEMPPNPDFVYHGTNAEGAHGIQSSGVVRATQTERNPEQSAAWFTDHPARAAAQGDHVIAIPRSNVERALSDHPLGMHSSPEDVHIEGNPLDTKTAQVHSESVPEATLHPETNELYNRQSYEQKAAYARAADNAVAESRFGDIVGLQRQGEHFGVGVWRGEANPGMASHYAIEKLDEATVKKLNAISAAEGMAKEQGSVSWGRPLAANARKGDNVFPAVLVRGNGNPGDLAKLGAEVDSKFGNGMVGVIHGPGGALYLVDFSGEIKSFAAKMKELTAADVQPLKWQGGYTIDERLKTEPWETTFQDALRDAPNSHTLINAVDNTHEEVKQIQNNLLRGQGAASSKYDTLLRGFLTHEGVDTTGRPLTAEERTHAENTMLDWADQHPGTPYAEQINELHIAQAMERNSASPDAYFQQGNDLLGSIAQAQGRSIKEVLPQEGEAAAAAAPRVKGAVMRTASGEHLLATFRGADASTGVHELYHVLDANFPELRDALIKAGLTNEETRARTFEAYMMSGARENLSADVRDTFNQIGAHMGDVYSTMAEIPGAKFNKEIGKIFDNFFMREAQHDPQFAHDFGASYHAQEAPYTIEPLGGRPNALSMGLGVPQEDRLTHAELMGQSMYHGDIPKIQKDLSQQARDVQTQRLSGVIRAYDMGDHIEVPEMYVEDNARSMQLFKDLIQPVVDHALATGKPIKADFANQKLGQLAIKWARRQGRDVQDGMQLGPADEGWGTWKFQTDKEPVAYTPSRSLAYRDLLVHPRPSRSKLINTSFDTFYDSSSEKLGRYVDKLRESDNPVAKQAGKMLTPFSSRSRVVRNAAKNFVEDAKRAHTAQHQAMLTLRRLDTRAGFHALKPGEGEGISHYWWAQLPESHRNTEGLKLIQQELKDSHEYLSNPDGAWAALANEHNDLTEQLKNMPKDAAVSDVFDVMRERGMIEQQMRDIPDHVEALKTNIAKLERIIQKPVEYNPNAIEAIRSLMLDREGILTNANVLDPERAQERTGLLARHLGLEPDGSEVYVGHRAGDLSRGASFPRGASFGGTAIPKGVRQSHVNRLILFRHGLLQQSMDSIIHDWAAAQGYQFAIRAKNDLAQAGEPILGYVKKDHVLVNPKGHMVPRAIHTDPEAQAASEGLNIDDITELVHNLFAENTPEQTRMIEAARELGSLHEVRQVPKDVAAKYYEAILGKRAGVATPGIRPDGVGATLGKALDTVNNMVYMSLIYTNPGYVPSILMQNMVFAGLHQGAYLPLNLARAGQVLARGPKDIADFIKGEVGVGALESLAGGKADNFTHRFIRVIHTVPDTWPRTAAFLHEAARAGIISRFGAVTPQDFANLRDLFTNPAKKEQLRELANFARQSQVDFTRLRPTEQALARRLLFVWPWIRGISAWPARFAYDHPIRTAALAAYVGAGTQGKVPFPHLVTKDVPTWLQEGIPAGKQTINGKVYPRVFSTRYVNPASTPFDLYQTLTGAPGAAVINSLLNPVISAAWHLGNKEDQFGHASKTYGASLLSNLESLVPNYKLGKDLISPPDVAHAGLYPGDTSRVGRIERALRIFPFAYDPAKALKDAEAQGLKGNLQNVHRFNLENEAQQAGVGPVPKLILLALDHKTALDHISATNKGDWNGKLQGAIGYYEKVTGNTNTFKQWKGRKLPDLAAQNLYDTIRQVLIGPGLATYESAVKQAAQVRQSASTAGSAG